MDEVYGKCHLPGLLAPEPLDRFSEKFVKLIMSAIPHHRQRFGSVGSKGMCLRMREIVIIRRFLARDSRPFVCPSVCHTGGSYKNG